MASDGHKEIGVMESTLAGLGAMTAGAIMAGGTHFVASTKKLQEEGIDTKARLRAAPLALKALMWSTLLCAGMGAAGLVSWKLYGQETKAVAEVSPHHALQLAQQQREAVQKEFRTRLGLDA